MVRTSLITTLLLIPLLMFYSSSTLLQFCTATHTITSTQPISDPQTIVSSGDNTFKLGFFSPVNSTNSNRYVGVWFNHIFDKAVVWVANRDNPLNDSSGTVTISKDGNLVVLDGQKQIVWSSDVANIASVNSSAQLSDSGKLILRDDTNGKIIWESFQHLSNSFLSGMKLSTTSFTDKKTRLTSWKSPSDPSNGRFTLGVIILNNIPEAYIWNGSHPHWRSGPWSGQNFIGVPEMDSVYDSRIEVVDDKQGNVYLSSTNANKSTLIFFTTLSSNGTLMEKRKEEGKETWENTWSAPATECEVYGKCGPFGSCNMQGSPICTCLQGFDPKDMEEWSRGNWTTGCVRKIQLQCERNITTGGEKGKEDGFLKLKKVKVPAFAEPAAAAYASEDECKSRCLNNCSCIAYAYYSGIGCMQWSGDLIDIQQFSSAGADLYIRVAYSELDKKRITKIVFTIAVIIGSVTLAIFLLSWRWMARRRGIEVEGLSMEGGYFREGRYKEQPFPFQGYSGFV